MKVKSISERCRSRPIVNVVDDNACRVEILTPGCSPLVELQSSHRIMDCRCSLRFHEHSSDGRRELMCVRDACEAVTHGNGKMGKRELVILDAKVDSCRGISRTSRIGGGAD